MTTIARFNGDCRITGNLQVDGSMPTIQRSELQQDTNKEFAIPLTDLRVWDALTSLLPASSANDDLGLSSGTFGTDAPKVTTGDVKAAGCTRYARCLVPIPIEYDDGQTLTLRVSAGMETTVADGSANLDAEIYKHDREGSIGSDICNTAQQNMNDTAFADFDFEITPTGLVGGDILDIRLKIAIVDSSTGTAVIGTIGAIELLADVKG